MEDEDGWCVGDQERSHYAKYEEIQRILPQLSAREISVFGGVLVLGFDILGESNLLRYNGTGAD